MAEVFLAVMEGPAKFSKLIALKMLRSQFAEDAEGREMFLNEARLAARLNHPNVVQTYEVGEIDERYFIAMEYLEGQPFSRILHRARSGEHAALPLAIALRIVADSLSGLEYAHQLKDFDGSPLNLVHRDISPHNVFVTYDGSVKVLDFGIAKAAGSSAETRTGILKGKVNYMAPEQISDQPLDLRVDVYAAGVMLWEVLAGRKVWKGLSDVATLSKVATEGVPSIRTAVPDVDPELERIVMKACARTRDARYNSASDLQAELEAYIEKLPEGGKATSRGIARWVSDVFKDMREETKRVVETQLSRAKSIPPTGMPSASFPSTHSQTGSQDSPLTRSTTGSGPREMTGSEARAAAAQGSASGKAALALVALAAVLVIGFVAWRSSERSAPAPATAPTQAASAVVKISATPASAHITVDGVAVASNPAQLTLARDGRSHVVRVQSEGHASKDETFVLDGDKSFSIVLPKLEKPAQEPPPPAVATAVSASGKPTHAPVAAKPGKHVATTTVTTTVAAPPVPTATATATAAPTATSTKKKIDEENPFN